jgi:hypothetical protein
MFVCGTGSSMGVVEATARVILTVEDMTRVQPGEVLITGDVSSDNYEMFRSLSTDPYCDANLRLLSDEVTMLTVSKGSPAEGKILEEIGLKGYGIELLAVYRDSEILINPDKGL